MLPCPRKELKIYWLLLKLEWLTVTEIIDEVCEEQWQALADYIKLPIYVDVLKKIATDFTELCDMPHCITTLIEKHIGFYKPAFSGSLWHN